MKIFKSMVFVGVIALPVGSFALTEDGGSKLQTLWKGYIQPAGICVLTSRPVKGVGALVAAGAASGIVGVAASAMASGLSYAIARDGRLSQCVGAGIGALAAIWFLDRLGGITARAVYAKMNGEKLSSRYKEDKKNLENRISGTLGFVNELKNALQGITIQEVAVGHNSSARDQWLENKKRAVTVLEKFLRDKNSKIDSSFGFVVREKTFFEKLWECNLASDELSLFQSDQLTDLEKNSQTNLLTGIKVIKIESDLKKHCDKFFLAAKEIESTVNQGSEATLVSSSRAILQAAQNIVDISSRNIECLSAALWRVEKALWIAEKFGI